MAYTIAVAGKGGTGKTTTAGLITTQLLRRQLGPILAVDADPNTCLNEWLGVEVEHTLGDVREEALRQRYSLPAGMDKHRYLEYRLQMCLVEASGFDLVAMGRTEGPDCYCYVNNILRGTLDMLHDNYRFVVMDNEAGMEHLSREVTRDVDQLLVISDATVIGVRSAGRIYRLAQLLNLRIGQAHLLLTRVMPSGSEQQTDFDPEGDLSTLVSPVVQDEIAKTDLDVLGVIPYDASIVEAELVGKPLQLLPPESPALQAMDQLLARLLP